MKSFLIKILRWKLKVLARLTIWRYRPGVIGVTGSVGKTSTKLAIASVLQEERSVRVSRGNFNNELGLPLTILGDWTHVGGIFFWIKVMLGAIKRLVVKSHYPDILILEYGVDRPGDMRYLLEIVRPNISVITAIGEIPAHLEFFSSPEALAREKGKLIEYLPTAGFAVLNQDDEAVMNLRGRTRARLMTFGFSRNAEMRIINFEHKAEDGRPKGISFKLEHAGVSIPVRVEGAFGKAQTYSAAAAASVGLIFGMNLVKIAEALRHYKVAKGRSELLPGIKDTFIIDDSYNASPLSMHAALDTLKNLPGKRKVAVLGDMLELGGHTMEAHQYLGSLVPKFADILVTVGTRAKFIAETAREKGMAKKNIVSFDLVEDARRPVQDLLKSGDLILVKGSHAMRLEEIVEEIKAL